MMKPVTLFDLVRTLYDDIDTKTKQVQKEIKDKPISNSTYGFQSYTVAELPSNLSGFMVAFASNGRKSGDASGSGTGVPVYYDVASNKWLSFYDNHEVAE